MNLLSSGDKLVEIVDDSIRLGFRNTDDSSDKARIEKYGIPSGDRIRPDEGMLGHDWVTTDCTAESVGSVRLDLCRM